MIGLGAGFIIPLILTWLYLKFGLSDTVGGPFLALSNLTIALAAVVSTRIASRLGLVRGIVATQGLSTIFMLSLAFVPDVRLAGGLYVIRAAPMKMSGPLGDSYLMGVMTQEERGLASAINTVVWRLPNSVSTYHRGLDTGSRKIRCPPLSSYDLLRNINQPILQRIQERKTARLSRESGLVICHTQTSLEKVVSRI